MKQINSPPTLLQYIVQNPISVFVQSKYRYAYIHISFAIEAEYWYYNISICITHYYKSTGCFILSWATGKLLSFWVDPTWNTVIWSAALTWQNVLISLEMCLQVSLQVYKITVLNLSRGTYCADFTLEVLFLK